MSERNGSNGKLRLKDALERTPPIDNPVEALRRQLAMAVFNGVKEQDVIDLAGKLKDMAMAGDHKAIKMYFELVLGKNQTAAPAPAEPKELSALASAMRDLVDEIRVARYTGGEPRITKEVEARR